MNSSNAYYQSRQTVITMLQERLGYQQPDQALMSALADIETVHYDANSVSDDGEPNQIDLYGWKDGRGVPIYVHFTRARNLTKTTTRRKLIAELGKRLANEENPDFLDQITIDDPYNLVAVDDIILGIHLIILFDGWDMGQTKTTRQLQLLSWGPKPGIPTKLSEEDSSELKYEMEMTPVHTLIKNPTRHQLVPKHRLLTNLEKRKLLTSQLKVLNQQDRLKYDGLTDQEARDHFLDRYFVGLMPKIGLYDPINIYYGGHVGEIYLIIRRTLSGGNSVTYKRVRNSAQVTGQKKN